MTGIKQRIGVIADIHGNLRALEAVVLALKEWSPDLVVNLGDHVSGPLQAAGTADLLMTLPYLNIRGNHDRQLVERPVEKMGESDRAAHAQLRPEHFEWLRALPSTMRLDGGVLLFHGIPANDLEYLCETVEPGLVRLAQPAELAARLDGESAGVYLCGHSHTPRLLREPGGALVLNPGSVGLPGYDTSKPLPHYMEAGSPHARFAVLDHAGGRWTPRFVAVEYDWDAAAAEAREAGRADWAHALGTGFALR